MTVPYVWVDLEDKVLWYPVVDTSRCMINLIAPADDWDRYDLIKVKFRSGKYGFILLFCQRV